MNYLQWYLDASHTPNGQLACKEMGAIETKEIWPVARLDFASETERQQLWQYLFARFGINAVAHYTNRGILD